MNLAPNWAFSSLMLYEQCPMRFKLAKIERIPEPPRPPDSPMERGNRVHKRLELFVQGNGAIDTEAKAIAKFEPALIHARELYRFGMATTEQDWLFDRDWNQCERAQVWLWMKLDLNVIDEDRLLAVPIDYKTGKSTYKTVEHIQQTQLYAAGTALRYPQIECIRTELWYLDEGWVRSALYTREEALRFVGRFEQRAQRIYDDKFFRPNPNKVTCKFCPYSPRGNGACPVGV